MRNKSSVMVAELINKENTPQRGKFRNLLASNDPQLMPTNNNDDDSSKHSNASSSSGYFYDSNSSCSSPFNASSSPYSKSPWNITTSNFGHENNVLPQIGLIGSIVREEGHVYSLATSGDLLYTGSDSKNVRIWKNLKDYSGFKSSSGLVKAIVIANEKVFTGHQDGKIRVWKMSLKNPSVHKRTGSLPKFKDTLRSSINPKNYVEVRRKRSALRIKHHDAVSCMSLNEHLGILYSGSWDRTVKVWRIADSKCIESIIAHDDAVNSIAVGFDSIVFTGSADGTVRMWKRELQGKTTQHKMISVLLSQENAVTALAVNKVSGVVYCGSSDGLVNFWEREKQSSITLLHGGVLKGHKMAVLCLAAAGNLVFSGSADRNICVWRRDHGGTHTCLAVLAGHMGPVKCLAVEEDKEAEKGQQNWIVYSGSLDRSVKVWRVCENSPEFQSNAGITAASGDARMIGHSLHGSQNGETFLKST